MPDTTVHPQHDRFFGKVFADPDVAAGFLRSVLPDEVARQIAWHTLSRVAGDFVDNKLRKSETDLLFEAERLGDGPPLRTFLVLEHQSSPDRWMPHRLLRYCEGVWSEDLKRGAKFLSPVIPVAFYQGPRLWKHSTRLADLFRKEVRGRPWIPPFEFLLVDQTKIGPEEVVGEEWGKLAQLLLMGAFQPDVEAAKANPEAHAKRKARARRKARAKREAQAKREAIAALAAALFVELEARGEETRLEVYFNYARGAVPHDILRLMGALMDQNGSPTGERILTLEEWSRAQGRKAGRAEGRKAGRAEGRKAGRAEGRKAGRAEGRKAGRAEGEQHATLRVVDGLVGAGVGWNIIEKATGLNEARFLALKAQLATG